MAVNGVRPLTLAGPTRARGPGHLTPASKRLWREILQGHELTPTELSTLEFGLVAADLAQRARREVAATASVVLTGGGNVSRVNPAVAVMLDAMKESRLAFGQLGLKLPETETVTWSKRARGLERKHERTQHG
jgi:hypothetical protein